MTNQNLSQYSQSELVSIFSKSEFIRVMKKAKHLLNCNAADISLVNNVISYNYIKHIKLFNFYLNFEEFTGQNPSQVFVKNRLLDSDVVFQTSVFVANNAFTLAVYLDLHQDCLMWGGLKGFSKEEFIVFKDKLVQQIELIKSSINANNDLYAITKQFIRNMK